MADHLEDSTRLAKNTGFMLLRLLIVASVGLYSSRVVLDVLGESDYGIYNVVGTVVVLMAFLRISLIVATNRFIAYELGAGDMDRLKKTFSMCVNVHVLLAAVLFLVLEAVGPWFIAHHLNIPPDRMTAAQIVFQLSLLTVCLDIVRAPYNSAIIAHERLSFYTLTSMVDVGMKLALILVLQFILFDKLILYAIMMCGVSVVMLLWYIGFSVKHFQETKYHYVWDAPLLKRLLSYSGWSLLVNAADVCVVQSISIFLNWFGTVLANAAVGIANQVNGQLLGVLGSFTQSYQPQIVKSYARGDMSYFNQLLFSMSKLSFLLLFVVNFPVAVYIHFILDLWLVEPPALASVFIIPIMVFSLIDAMSMPLIHAVHATGNIRTHQILMSIIKILNIPIIYLLLRAGSPLVSAYIVWAVMNLVCCVVRIIYMGHLIKLPVWHYFREVFGSIAIVLVLSVPLPLWYYLNSVARGVPAWQSVGPFLVIFLVVYGLVVYCVGLRPNERDRVRHILHFGKSRPAKKGMEMDGQTLARYQAILVETAAAFDRFCNEHGIRYFAAYGTALGAVRDGGLIPWDDDFDVYMLREDYERLIALKDSLPDGYEMLIPGDPDYALPFSKWCSARTTRIENWDFPFVEGVFIDLFPLDYAPDDPEWVHKMQEKMSRKFDRYVRAITHHPRWTWRMPGDLLLYRPRKKALFREWERGMKQISDAGRGPCITRFTRMYSARLVIMPATWFDHAVMVPFESSVIPVMAEYESYLDLVYGDWHQLPPPEKRVSTHDVVYLDLDARALPKKQNR